MTTLVDTPTTGVADTATFDTCHACDRRPATQDGILCDPCRAAANHTTTVRRLFTIPLHSWDPSDQGSHYLGPDDPTITLCGIPAEETGPNWDDSGSCALTRDIASCFTCQHEARLRKVGP